MAEFNGLSQKQKMLGAALYAHRVKRENIVTIMMVLDTEDQVDDMTWFIGQNPHATDEQLVAVAYQLKKESESK